MKDSLFGKVLLLEDVGNANKALIVELFYDLIFVAAMYRVSKNKYSMRTSTLREKSY